MRNKCRFCGNERKEGVEWYDDDYCSGKCKKRDGGIIPPAAKPDKFSRAPASFEDYIIDYPKNIGEKDGRGQRIKGRMPKIYRRRFEPEKMNWGEPLTPEQLNQAGLRCNREPIPGDWDFVETPDVPVNEMAAYHNDWQALKARAKELGIKTHAKNKQQIEAEIQEKENA